MEKQGIHAISPAAGGWTGCRIRNSFISATSSVKIGLRIILLLLTGVLKYVSLTINSHVPTKYVVSGEKRGEYPLHPPDRISGEPLEPDRFDIRLSKLSFGEGEDRLK